MSTRIPRAIVGSCISALMVVAMPRGFSQQPGDQTVVSHLREVAAPAWKEYSRRLDLLQGDAVMEATAALGGKQLNNSTIRLSRKVGKGGKCVLVVEQVENADGTKSQVFAVNSQYAFSLSSARPGAAGRWILSSISVNDDATRTEILRKLNQRLNTFRAPIMVRDRLLETMVQETDFSAGGDPDKPSDKAAVKFSYSREPKLTDGANYRPVRAGNLSFLPELSWAIKNAKVVVKTEVASGICQTSIDYITSTKGLPLPTQWLEEESLKLNDGGLFTSRKFTKFTLHPEVSEPSEVEFTLSAYGLPEPVGVTWSKATPNYVWFLLAAAILGVLAIAFRTLHRRRARVKNPMAPPPAR